MSDCSLKSLPSLSMLRYISTRALSHWSLMGHSGTLENTNALTTADPRRLVCGPGPAESAGRERVAPARAVSHHHCAQLAQRGECHLSRGWSDKDWEERRSKREQGLSRKCVCAGQLHRRWVFCMRTGLCTHAVTLVFRVNFTRDKLLGVWTEHSCSG